MKERHDLSLISTTFQGVKWLRVLASTKSKVRLYWRVHRTVWTLHHSISIHFCLSFLVFYYGTTIKPKTTLTVYIGIPDTAVRGQDEWSGGGPKSLWGRRAQERNSPVRGLLFQVDLKKPPKKNIQGAIMRNAVFLSSPKYGVYDYCNCYWICYKVHLFRDIG